MKKVMYVSLFLGLAFISYVAVVNRNSRHMTLKQQLMKAFYPVLMWFSKKGNKTPVLSGNAVVAITSLYGLTDTLSNGTSFDFAQFKGKKILLVNTASDCGYTAQYEDLEKLNKQFHGKLIIVGFPSNDFNEQEKAADSAIEKFCKINYGVSFPLMKKSQVTKSVTQNKVYQWLTNPAQNGWNSKVPEWNFSKYLIDEQGNLSNYFAPSISPLDAVIVNEINR